MSERAGFDAATWRLVKPFDGRLATPADVERSGAAVFALGDTINGQVIILDKPAPVIWRDDDEDYAAVVAQAESHENEDGEILEVLGLVLPAGETAVALWDDVDFVEPDDEEWLALLDAHEPVDDDDLDDEDDSEDEDDDDRP